MSVSWHWPDRIPKNIYVGKAASEHTLPQAEFNALLVQKAREGKNVARLKGGDPFVFGREEKKRNTWWRTKSLLKSSPGLLPQSRRAGLCGDSGDAPHWRRRLPW